MGQLVLGSLWGYIKYFVISFYLLFEVTQPIVFELDNSGIRELLQISLRFMTAFTFFFFTIMKVESYLVLRVTKDEERKKLKLENELLELKIKKYGTDKFYKGEVCDSDPCIEQ